MITYKIHKSERLQKRDSERERIRYNNTTPPKYMMRSSIYNTVARWEKHCGYNFEVPENELTPMLRQSRQVFRDKAVKYCRGDVFAKKQTRFDKMKLKEETGFRL